MIRLFHNGYIMNSQEWYSAMTLWWDNSSLLCAMVLWLYIPWFWGNMIILGYTMIMLCSYGGILLYGADSQPCSHSNRKYFLCAFFIILCYANECIHYHHSTTNYIWSSLTWSSLIWLFLIQLNLHLDSPDVIWGTLRRIIWYEALSEDLQELILNWTILP